MGETIQAWLSVGFVFNVMVSKGGGQRVYQGQYIGKSGERITKQAR